MLALLWTALSVAGLWLVMMLLFIAVMHCKLILELEDRQLSLFWKVHIVPFAVIGVILDVVFNLTIGTVMFMELPKELLFTSRCKRHKHESPIGWRRDLAWFACKQLDQIDPGHCG